MEAQKKSNFAEVSILGEEYRIRGDAQKIYIEKIAHIVDKRIRELREHSPHLSPRGLAILTAVNFADELMQEKIIRSRKDNDRETARRTAELISLVDEALTASSPL